MLFLLHYCCLIFFHLFDQILKKCQNSNKFDIKQFELNFIQTTKHLIVVKRVLQATFQCKHALLIGTIWVIRSYAQILTSLISESVNGMNELITSIEAWVNLRKLCALSDGINFCNQKDCWSYHLTKNRRKSDIIKLKTNNHLFCIWKLMIFALILGGIKT